MSESEKNTPKAINRALNEGFGIETDLRDLNGEIVISHDPPRVNLNLPTLEWLLKQVNISACRCRIALNIKSDGLSNLIESKIASHGANVNQFFAFDMSVPDSLSYMKGSIPVYLRISEYEQIDGPTEQASGIWVDNFSGAFPQVKRAKELIDMKFRTTIVSSELHHRDHVELWKDIIDSGIHLSPLFELCTDYPMEAANQFLGV